MLNIGPNNINTLGLYFFTSDIYSNIKSNYKELSPILVKGPAHTNNFNFVLSGFCTMDILFLKLFVFICLTDSSLVKFTSEIEPYFIVLTTNILSFFILLPSTKICKPSINEYSDKFFKSKLIVLKSIWLFYSKQNISSVLLSVYSSILGLLIILPNSFSTISFWVFEI